MTHMFIAGAELVNGQAQTFRRDAFRCHLSAVETLTGAGIHPPAEWTALRDRYAAFIDLGDGGVDRLTAEIIQPSGADLVSLRSSALAEEIARNGDNANINQRVQTAVGRELEALYSPGAEKNYKQAAARYDDAATHFTVAAKTVDVEAGGQTLVTCSAPAREYWLCAPALAAELDAARAVLYAAASLCDGVPADVAFATAASDIDTTEHQIALATDPGKAHRRKVWSAWHATGARTGKWGGLVSLGVKLRAASAATVTPYKRPEKPVSVVGPSGKVEYWDPHDGPLQAVRPGFRPVQVGWIAEKPQVKGPYPVGPDQKIFSEMAITNASYYADEGPEIPTPGGDYTAPDPHAAVTSHRPFTAPSSMPTDNPAPEPHGAWDFADSPQRPTKPGGA